MKNMKILSVFAIALFMMILLSSCKRDWKCTCVTKIGDSETEISGTISDKTMKDAKEQCHQGNAESPLLTRKCRLGL